MHKLGKLLVGLKFGPSKLLQILYRVNLGISLAKTPTTPTIRRLLVIPFRKYSEDE